MVFVPLQRRVAISGVCVCVGEWLAQNGRLCVYYILRVCVLQIVCVLQTVCACAIKTPQAPPNEKHVFVEKHDMYGKIRVKTRF